jgi:hypothetical protein
MISLHRRRQIFGKADVRLILILSGKSGMQF